MCKESQESNSHMTSVYIVRFLLEERFYVFMRYLFESLSTTKYYKLASISFYILSYFYQSSGKIVLVANSTCTHAYS